MVVESLFNHFHHHEWTYEIFMTIIGFANEVHTPIIAAYSVVFAMHHDYLQDFSMFLCFVLGFPILARTINARWIVVFNHRPRIHMACAGFVVAYIIVITSYVAPMAPATVLTLLSAAAIISTCATSIGEASMIGYLKGIPQELIFLYNMGKQGAKFFSIFALGVMKIKGIDTVRFFLPCVLMLGPYLWCFDWIEYQRLSHSQEYNVYRLKNPGPSSGEEVELIDNPEGKESQINPGDSENSPNEGKDRQIARSNSLVDYAAYAQE